MTSRTWRGALPLLVLATLAASGAGAQQAGVLSRMSVSSAGEEGNYGSGGATVSADGRFVAFDSAASNLVPGDTNGNTDVFVHDTQTGVVERVSMAWNGNEARDDSRCPSISADGRMVAFLSQAWNMFPGGANLGTPRDEVFVRDRQTGVTTRLTAAFDGGMPNNHSYCPKISADGRRVVFASRAMNLVKYDGNYSFDVFLYDLQKGKLKLVSRTADGRPANSASYMPVISADGRSVAFVSYATDLDGVALGDLRYFPRAFVRDLEAGTTELVDVPRLQPGMPDGSAFEVALSGDGRVVAFGSYATNLVSPPPAETAWGNLYVRNRDTGKTILATALDPLATGCTIGWGGSPCSPGSNSELSLSADGRWLSFISYSQRLLPMSFTHAPQAYLFDALGGRLRRISVDPSGWEGACSGGGGISDDGSVVAFVNDGGLVPQQTGARDVYRQEWRRTADRGTRPLAACPLKPSSCEPAVESVFRLRKHPPGGIDEDRVFWRWRGAPQSAPLPDPTAGARYQLCVYSADGRVAMDVGTPDVGACPAGSGPCWQSSGRQYKLRDPKGGLGALTIVGGPLPRILVRGSGQLIDAPFLPLKGVGFTVQLQDATSGRCWSADFPGAAVQKNFGGKPGDGSRSDGALTAQMR